MSLPQQEFEDWTRSSAERLEVTPSAESKAKFMEGLHQTSAPSPFAAFTAAKWWVMAASLTGLVALAWVYFNTTEASNHSPAVLVLEDYTPGPSEAMPMLIEFQMQQHLLANCKSKQEPAARTRY